MTIVESVPERLYLTIAKKLAEMVSAEEIKIGERFPAERELAAKYQVSRSTIREAMIALEVSGLIEIRSGSGIYALPPSFKLQFLKAKEDIPGPFEVLEARLMLECEAAGLAAERISNQELHQLKQLLHLMEQAIQKNDIEEAEKIDHTFHLKIIEAARNSALIPMYQWLWNIRELSAVSKQFHLLLRKKGSTPNVSEHKVILDALMQRDAELARQAIRTHLTLVMNRLTSCSLT